MTVVRLIATTAGMAGVAAALQVLAPAPGPAVRTLRDASEVAAAGGGDAVVLAVTGLLAWAAWAWGAVGLLLTALGGLPGLPGAVARLASRVLVPGRLRAAAAIALGAGLAVAGPAAAAPAPPAPPPDWPTAAEAATPPPDRPAAPTGPEARPDEQRTADRYVVVPGDCLWHIAADGLGGVPSDAVIADAVTAWWTANADVIGPDPDLIHPGQVLQAPPTDSDPAGGPR